MATLCGVCKVNDARGGSEILPGLPVCFNCDDQLQEFPFHVQLYTSLSIVFTIGLVLSFYAFVTQVGEPRRFASIAVLVLTVAVLVSVLLAVRTVKRKRKLYADSGLESFVQEPLAFRRTSRSETFQIPGTSIVWIEKELIRLNQAMYGENHPPPKLNFLQRIPSLLLEKEKLSEPDVGRIAQDLVQQTRQRVGRLDVPFRNARVIFDAKGLLDEPGHIEFGNSETIIRIRPHYVHDPFGLIAILCHELAHFILDQNGLRKDNRLENEKLTDLFVFKVGQGLVSLQGILDFVDTGDQRVETRLGYLSLAEMAYAQVRCSSQFNLTRDAILPKHFVGKAFDEVEKAIRFLTPKNDVHGHVCEIVLCPKGHVLRVSKKGPSANIRCPKCAWRKEIWFHKSEQRNSLIETGVRKFDAGEIDLALKIFRNAQSVERENSLAYCWAARCLKRQGKHQDAIREIRKLLTICPEDKMANDEMKVLIDL